MNMIKQFSAIALVVALSACSSDSGSDPETTTGGSATAGGGGGGGGGGTPVEPTGNVQGAWFGNNNFGTGVMIIDASQNVYALTSNGTQHESVFGPASAPLQRFLHRDSENSAFSDSFTLVGDLPSALSGNVADDTVVYNLAAENEGQQISNTVTPGNFTMTFADENALPNLSLAQAAGSWSAKTSFCPTDCNFTVNMDITAAGQVTGTTVFNVDGIEALTGDVTAAAGATQYLNVSLTWLGEARTGVLYRDRNDTNRLIVNTIGPNPDGTNSQSFTATMVRQ